MDIEWLVAAMREANSFLTTPTALVNEPALVRRHRGVRGLDGDWDRARETRVAE
jgi:hypothetical protein